MKQGANVVLMERVSGGMFRVALWSSRITVLSRAPTTNSNSTFKLQQAARSWDSRRPDMVRWGNSVQVGVAPPVVQMQTH